MVDLKYVKKDDGKVVAQCPECKSTETEFPVFDGMDRQWFVCHHCGYEVWVH
jgi:transposase-like protein